MGSALRRLGPRLARHVVWGGLVVLHCVPLVLVLARLVQGGEGWGSLGTLLLTQALFVGKWADVRWLRMPSRQGAVLAFLLATVLAHPQGTVEHLGQAAPEAGAAVIALAPAAARPRRLKRAVRRLLGGSAERARLWIDALVTDARREAVLAPVPRHAAPSPPGRAPPVKTRV